MHVGEKYTSSSLALSRRKKNAVNHDVSVYGCVSFGWEKIDRERERSKVWRNTVAYFFQTIIIGESQYAYACIREGERESTYVRI